MGGALFRTCGAQENIVLTESSTDSSMCSNTIHHQQQQQSTVRRLRTSFSSPSNLSLYQFVPSTKKEWTPEPHISDKTSTNNESYQAFPIITKQQPLLEMNSADDAEERPLLGKQPQPTLRKGRTMSVLTSSSSAAPAETSKETLLQISQPLSGSSRIGLQEGPNSTSNPIFQPFQIVAINPPIHVSGMNYSTVRLVNLTTAVDTTTITKQQLVIDSTKTTGGGPVETNLKENSILAPPPERNVGNNKVRIQIEQPPKHLLPTTRKSGTPTLRQLKKNRLQKLKEKMETKERLMEFIMEEQSDIKNYLKSIGNHQEQYTTIIS